MDAYTQSVHTDIATVATNLNSYLGTTLTAFLAGAKSRQLPYRWASKEVVPRRDAETRLRFAYRAWLEISAQDGPDVARAWVIGANPRLQETSPAEAIRDGRFTDVRAAVAAFLEGQYA